MKITGAVYKRLIFFDRINKKGIVFRENIVVFKRVYTDKKQYNNNLNFNTTYGYNRNKHQWVVVIPELCPIPLRIKVVLS